MVVTLAILDHNLHIQAATFPLHSKTLAYWMPTSLKNATWVACWVHSRLHHFRTSAAQDWAWSLSMMVAGMQFTICLPPYGSSINDSINPEDYALSYCSVDDTFAIVSALGKGTIMAKIDLKNAFCLVPVRPEDWNLLGIQWQDQFYIDNCLPFGLRSAPFLFNQLADAIHWSLQHNHGVRHVLHYLDDFFTAGSPGTKECSDNLQAMLSLCNNINSPVKTSKIEGPSTRLTFLGIVIDTENMTASISPERKADLILSIQSLRKKDKCTKHQLLSLVGKPLLAR